MAPLSVTVHQMVLMQLTVILIIIAIRSLLLEEEKRRSLVNAKPVLRPGQGPATGNHHSRQEAPTSYNGKLQAPDEQANQSDACENTQWSANTSHFH